MCKDFQTSVNLTGLCLYILEIIGLGLKLWSDREREVVDREERERELMKTVFPHQEISVAES